MLLQKQGFPEENELIICTVTKVQYHSVFVNLDEYNKSGMIHISEVSPGRIRNIRDFVKEGKKVICLVLRVHKDKGHIDLSLRRVNEGQKKAKINEIKKQQMAEKILEFLAKKHNIDVKKLFEDISSKVLEKYDSLYSCFEDVVVNKGVLKKIGIDKKILSDLEEAIKQRVKEAKVKVEGKMKVLTYDPDGLNLIKEGFKKARDIGKDNYIVRYLGGGSYEVKVEAKDFKQAEKILKESNDTFINFIESKKGVVEFVRASS